MLVLTTVRGSDLGHIAFAPDGASLAASAAGVGIDLWNFQGGSGRPRRLGGLASGDFCFHPSV